MSVLVVIQGDLRPGADEALNSYRAVARPVIQKHGGQTLGAGGGVKAFGEGKVSQVGFILRFADLAAVEAWLNDPDYQKVLPLRQKAYTRLEVNVYQE